jgi:high affinity sulfate transporter 1
VASEDSSGSREGGRLAANIPIVGWLPGWRSFARRDALAALAVWAVLVPQGMAYATLAGVPPVYGLYAALGGLVVYAVLGTSRQLNVGPSSSIAVLSAATIAPLAAADSARFLVLSATLALMTGAILIAAGLARLGFVAEFLAKPVLAGYFVGLALVIAVSQLPKLLGVDAESVGFPRRLWNLAGDADAIHGATIAVGVGTLALILALRAIAPRVPGPLVAVALGVLVSRTLDLEDRGVAVVGEISSALPDIGLPGIGWTEVNRLLAGAVGVAILAYAESIAAARSFAEKHDYEVDPNRELVALGAANVGSGLLKGFPIDASLSRTAVADDAGQRSQLAGLLNALLVLTTILVLTPFFADLPQASLAAIVIAAVLPLMRTGELRRLRRLDELDFMLAVVCLLGVLLFGVLGGLGVAVIASLGALVYRSARPHTATLGRVHARGEEDEDFGFRDVSRHPEGETYPGLIIFRFDQEIFFANALFFRDRVRELVAEADPPARAILLDAAAITHVDTTGLDILRDVHEELSAGGVRLMIARMKGPVHDILERAALMDVIGRENFFPTVHAGVAEYAGRDGSRQ